MGRLSPRLLALIAVATAAAAASAFAADMAAPVYKTPGAYQPASYDWTGIYLGGLVGAGLLQDSVTATASTLEPAGAQTKYSPFAVVGGGEIGVNFEMAPWVFGLEGDFLSSDISGSQTTTSLVAGSSARATSAPHWYAMGTGRIGYAANDLLFYAKGGGAFMRVDYSQDILNTITAVTATGTIADSRTGFTVGGGFEYAMNEALSVKLEYDFLDFGTKNYTFPLSTPTGTIAAPFAINSDTHLFLLGFNYRFNWVQRSPLAARY